MQDVKEKINNIIKEVDKYIDIYTQEKYPEKIYKSMRYSLLAGGKRLRPTMAIEVATLFGAKIEEIMPTAVAIEMLHCQSLIHDDLPSMDNDDFRRGKPSNHKAFDEATAILAGDALLSYAPKLIIEKTPTTISAETKLQVLKEFFQWYLHY
jgi:geranylgeranyl diphosphate synthase type II